MSQEKDGWTSDQRYILVTMEEDAEAHFRTVTIKHPLFVLGVASLVHEIQSRPEYQAGNKP